MPDPKDLYLDLLKKTLTFMLWDESKLFKPAEIDPHPFYKKWVIDAITSHLAKDGRRIMEQLNSQDALRIEGRDWPHLAHTMIGLKRLNNLDDCVRSVIKYNVPGDLIETGVWRGGACILMRAVLKAYDVEDRVVWLADSFAGLPEPDTTKYPADAGDRHHRYDELRITQEDVVDSFRRYDLFDDQVKFLVGWFKDTLPTAPIEQLAVIRLDGDMYESTWEALTNLYPKLSPGGYCIIDDYNLKGCRAAVFDYREQHGIAEEIVDIDGWGAFWRRASN
jgi:O-methyltransferase